MAAILLVEDDPEVGDILRLSLQAHGFSTTLANSVGHAREHLAAGRYDLVISDFRLPDGDGMMVLNQAADAAMKTLLISAYLFQVGEADPRHEYLMKPMRPGEFIAAVERMLQAG